MITQDVVQKEYSVVIIGDGRVGKTTLLDSHLNNRFNPSFTPTRGINVKTESLKADSMTHTFVYKDLGGQDALRMIREAYMTGAHAAIICYDSSNRNSFFGVSEQAPERLGYFIKSVVSATQAKYRQMIPLVFVATKHDLYEEKTRQGKLSEIVDSDYSDELFRVLRDMGLNVISYENSTSGLNVSGAWEPVFGSFETEASKYVVETSAKGQYNVHLPFKMVQKSLLTLESLSDLEADELGRHLKRVITKKEEPEELIPSTELRGSLRDNLF